MSTGISLPDPSRPLGPSSTQRPAHADREVELKLVADPARLRILADAATLAGRPAADRGTARLISTYYDTDDRRLARRGVGYRVRTTPEGREQTVKTEARAGQLTRGEWTTPLDGEAPEPAAFGDPDVAAALGLLLPGDLVPLFETRIDRRTRVVEVGDAEASGASGLVEVCFDVGTISAGERIEPIAEIELELVEGRPEHLYALALDLTRELPLRIASLSKAGRGHRLARGEAPRPLFAQPVTVARDSTVSDALARFARSAYGHWLGNDEAVLDGADPEGVHQMRVALRRLRSLLALFGRAIPIGQLHWLKEETRWLAGELGPARDWDVFLLELLPPAEAALGADPFGPLRAAATRERALAHDRARSAVTCARHGQLQLRVGQWLETRAWDTGEVDLATRPVRAFADGRLARRHQAAVDAGKGFAGLTIERRHDLRILVKKLRYAVDFFRDLYAEAATKTYARHLRTLQADLGHLQDVATAEALVEVLTRADPSPDLARAGGLLVGWHTRGLVDGEGALRRAWRDFARTDPFWRAGSKSRGDGRRC